MVLLRLVRIAPDVDPLLQLLGLWGRDSQSFCDEGSVLERVALGHAFVLEAAEMERLVCERVCSPRCVELREAAVAVRETREVDVVEVPKGLAGLWREIGVVRGPARCIEADASCFAARIDEAREEAGTADADPASREVARDGGELILLAHTLLVAREAERRESADDEEEDRNGPHRYRIGTAPDGIEGLCGSEPLADFGAESGHRRRSDHANLPEVVQIAPRYDPQILLAVRALDDRTQPMAEISRRVGAAAAEFGLPKPSYVHLRRLIVAHREEEDAERRRHEEIRQILGEVYLDLHRGRVVNAYDVADRIREAGR